jgi:hypothetical protein
MASSKDWIDALRTLDDALSAWAGEVVAVWDIGDAPGVLFLFSLAGGVTRKAGPFRLSESEKVQLCGVLSERKVSIGRTARGWHCFWRTGERFEVWDTYGRVIDADRAGVYSTLSGWLDAARLVSVETFVRAGEHWSWGINLITARGERMPAARTFSATSKAEPACTAERAMVEGLWAVHLGRDLAQWYRVRHRGNLW